MYSRRPRDKREGKGRSRVLHVALFPKKQIQKPLDIEVIDQQSFECAEAKMPISGFGLTPTSLNRTLKSEEEKAQDFKTPAKFFSVEFRLPWQNQHRINSQSATAIENETQRGTNCGKEPFRKCLSPLHFRFFQLTTCLVRKNKQR